MVGEWEQNSQYNKDCAEEEMKASTKLREAIMLSIAQVNEPLGCELVVPSCFKRGAGLCSRVSSLEDSQQPITAVPFGCSGCETCTPSSGHSLHGFACPSLTGSRDGRQSPSG